MEANNKVDSGDMVGTAMPKGVVGAGACGVFGAKPKHSAVSSFNVAISAYGSERPGRGSVSASPSTSSLKTSPFKPPSCNSAPTASDAFLRHLDGVGGGLAPERADERRLVCVATIGGSLLMHNQKRDPKATAALVLYDHDLQHQPILPSCRGEFNAVLRSHEKQRFN